MKQLPKPGLLIILGALALLSLLVNRGVADEGRASTVADQGRLVVFEIFTRST